MRLPFAPLAAVVGSVYYPHQHRNQHGPTDLTVWVPIEGYPISMMSELTGIGRRRLTRWALLGVPEDQADRVACALGRHPCEVWPTWFDLEETA